MHRLGSNSRQLAVEVGVKEGPKCNLDAFEVAQHATELLLRLDATEDEIRMLVAGWQKSACYFNARMAGLHGLLR